MKKLILSLALASSGLAMAVDLPSNPLDPSYKQGPAFHEIHKGDGAMTRDDYMNYVNRSWGDKNAAKIDKTHPKYSQYKDNARFKMMDQDGDGSVSQEEYRAFHEKAWGNKDRMTRDEYDAWAADNHNPLNPNFQRN